MIRRILTYLNGMVNGIAIGFVLSILWVVGSLLLPEPFAMFGTRTTGAGGLGAVSVSSGATLAVFLVGFAAGFYWTLVRAAQREEERRHASSRR